MSTKKRRNLPQVWRLINQPLVKQWDGRFPNLSSLTIHCHHWQFMTLAIVIPHSSISFDRVASVFVHTANLKLVYPCISRVNGQLPILVGESNLMQSLSSMLILPSTDFIVSRWIGRHVTVIFWNPDKVETEALCPGPLSTWQIHRTPSSRKPNASFHKASDWSNDEASKNSDTMLCDAMWDYVSFANAAWFPGQSPKSQCAQHAIVFKIQHFRNGPHIWEYWKQKHGWAATGCFPIAAADGCNHHWWCRLQQAVPENSLLLLFMLVTKFSRADVLREDWMKQAPWY